MTTKHPDFGLHKKSFPNNVDVDRIVKAMKAKSKMYFEGNQFGSPETVSDGSESKSGSKMTFKCKSPGTLDGDDDAKANGDFGETNWGVATPLFEDGEEPSEYYDDVIYSKLAKLNQQKADEINEKCPKKPKMSAKGKPKFSSSLARYSSFSSIVWACIISILTYVFIWFMK